MPTSKTSTHISVLCFIYCHGTLPEYWSHPYRKKKCVDTKVNLVLWGEINFGMSQYFFFSLSQLQLCLSTRLSCLLLGVKLTNRTQRAWLSRGDAIQRYRMIQWIDLIFISCAASSLEQSFNGLKMCYKNGKERESHSQGTVFQQWMKIAFLNTFDVIRIVQYAVHWAKGIEFYSSNWLLIQFRCTVHKT